MKKLIAILMALTLMTGAGLVAAEGIDLAGLSDDEIVDLMNRVQAEVVDRHIEGTATLASGSYIAGRDIPVGSYVFTCLATGDDWGSVTVYADKGEGNQLLWEIVFAPDEGESPKSFFVTLDKDDQLKSGVPFSLTIYAGITFK